IRHQDIKMTALVLLMLIVSSLTGKSTACCPPTWTAYENSCYRVFRTNKSTNWLEASDLCRLHRSPNCDEVAHLAKIETYEENNFLSQWLWSAYYAINTYAWIGLRENPIIGKQFTWLDGEKLDRFAYNNWKLEENKPSMTPGECVYMAVDGAEGWQRDYGSWKDFPCVHKEQWLEAYLCEMAQCR
ncbi:snaclec jerdonibitin subunit beta-like, partial [Anneissia japonica]|uniref:snaclec jerdonibitin subunit beta-like n=1 Tax=Anneissia japonica TaxID=1529436 RepID=UPI0014258AF8